MGQTWVPEVPFMSRPFGAHGTGMRVPIRLWCGSLGVVSAGAMGGACSALDIFKASWVRIHGLGSNAFHCCSRRSGSRYWWAACCGVAPGPVGKEGGGCGDPSFFLVLFFKHGHTVFVASLHACAERALLSPGVWGQSGHEFLISLRQHWARIARSLVRRCVGDPARSFSVTWSSNESTSKIRLAPRVRLASQVLG
mgnify:CR=1 FL=1